MVDTPSRILAVIMHADVADSTALVQRNESEAHRRIQDVFHRLSRTVTAYGGTAHEIRGDALVAEFSRASDAVCAAVAFQRQNAGYNAELKDGIRPELRMGVSLGEVVVADGTVTGAGAVLAQRLEQLAESGCIVVQGSVSDTVPDRLPFEFHSLGEQALKGFDQPVRAFRVHLKPGADVPEPDSTASVAGLPGIVASTAEKQRRVALHDKSSVAVLPFTNMSGDEEQEYFADGIAEDLMTSLSKLSQLLVIAHNSSSSYKGQGATVQRIGDELGVQFLVEGSVRKSGNRVRITSQLIDCATGGHLWAERFDRELNDVFTVQDEVTRAIISAMAVELTADERERLKTTGTNDLDAYDFFLRGREQYRRLSRDGSAQAEALLNRAIDLDPGYATAYAYLVFTQLTYYVNRWKDPVDRSLEYAHELATRAVALDDTDPYAHLSLGKTRMWKRQHDQAILEHERTIALDPNFAVAHAGLGLTLHYSGRSGEAIELINRGMRLDPHYPDVRLLWLAQPYFHLGSYEQAIDLLKRHLIRKPGSDISRVFLAASYGHSGRKEEARLEWNEALRIDPGYSPEHLEHVLPYKNPADFQKIIDGLDKAKLTW